ncbi:hypothetical protein [Carnobacterium mobile]|uniref:hypothetical protein n=1 Tax=Carnobacterium mobile TaxID=2750 RepID=UPI0018663B57|nr:hypothetical protein [Carnobacterium mobile]
MSLYKLYKQCDIKRNPVTENIMVPSISGSDHFTFGFEFTPDEYKSYEQKIWKSFLKYAVMQHIMTDDKFIKIIDNAEYLNIKIKKVKFDFEPEYYEEFIQDIVNLKFSNQDILKETKEFLNVDGAKIQQLNVQINESNEIIHIFDDGCIFCNSNVNVKSKDFKKLITYITSGKMVQL